MLIQLLLHHLLHVLLVLSSSVSLLLYRGVEVSNDLVSPHCGAVIRITNIDDGDIVSVTGATPATVVITGTTSTRMVIGDLDDDDAEQPQAKQHLDSSAALLAQQHVVAVAPPTAVLAPLARQISQAAS